MVKRFSKFFHSENSVRQASLLLLITMALSNVMGLLRDHFLARYITTSQLDIYFAAFRIPDLVFNFLILGGISSAFVPIFCDFIAKNKLKEGWKVANSFLNILFSVMLFAAVVLIIIMPWLTRLVVPDFSPEKMAQTTQLSRILMITPLFFTLSYIFSGILNSFKRFVSYAFAPLVYNLAIILGAIFVAPHYGIKGVTILVVVGAFLHMAIQLPSVARVGWQYLPIFDWRDKAVRRIIQLMIPRTVGLGVNQILLIAYTAIGSTLAAGSISAFNFANNIQTMPIVVFGNAFATAVFPTLTTAISEEKFDVFAKYLSRTIRSISFFLIPSSVLFIMIRAQIVRLILGSGQFGWDDTKTTALALGFFSISLLAQGLVPLFARSFYAMKNTRTPMYVSVITVIISIVLAYPLSRVMGVAGLALSFTIGSTFNAVVLYLLLLKKEKNLFDIKVIYSMLKVIFISGIMALAVRPTLYLMAEKVNMDTFFGVLLQSAVAVAVAIVIFFAGAKLFKCEEITWALKRKINVEAN